MNLTEDEILKCNVNPQTVFFSQEEVKLGKGMSGFSLNHFFYCILIPISEKQRRGDAEMSKGLCCLLITAQEQ